MTFYVVATPIGNLEDITYRAVRVLGEVDVVLCEDTRQTGKLLNHYNIDARTMSYHAQASGAKEEKIIEMVREGKTLALVSDAGTPAISDPGVRLIARLYDEFPDIKIVALPGASALTAALSISGISVANFMFLGFIPQKKGKQKFIETIVNAEMSVAFYESVHRIEKTLDQLAEAIPENRKVIVAREITKMFEEVVRGSGEEVRDYFKNNPDRVRGEFVVLVGKKNIPQPPSLKGAPKAQNFI